MKKIKGKLSRRDTVKFGSISVREVVQKWFHSNDSLSSDETLRLLRWIKQSPKITPHKKLTTEITGSISRRKATTSDRRSFNPSPEFPFEDREGTLVDIERRHIPDRRVNNIEVDWLL